MTRFGFERLQQDQSSNARRGRILTGRGTVQTPAFMPVATRGAVRGVTPTELRSLGAEILLANAYHLHLRPGAERICSLGGLSRFMGWEGPVLTDSGGYQIFSLAGLVKLSDEGVRFRSHLDGSLHDLTPEQVIGIQVQLGVDVMMPLDDCPPFPSERSRLEASTARTSQWLDRSCSVWDGSPALFGIVQGGTVLPLRQRSCEEAVSHDLPGYAVGGLSVGEPQATFYETAAATVQWLPPARPRYMMGAGTPEDLIRLVGMGYDLFDCVLPTRNARNGTLFTSSGRLNIRRREFSSDPRPADSTCGCPVCACFSRAYLRHLAVSGELLSACLNSVHNLAFYLRLVREMREALEQGRFTDYTSRTLARLSGDEEAR